MTLRGDVRITQVSDMEAPRISACIVTYNRDDELIHSLNRLTESSFTDFEILIIDNGDSPELECRIKALSTKQKISLVKASENRGCASLNELFSKARAPIIACFDDDSYPHPSCLEKVWKIFEERPDLGMIGFKMHLPETGTPWHDPWWNPDITAPKATILCIGCGLAFRNDARLPREICLPDIVSQAHELSMAAEVARLDYEIEFRPECIAYHPDTRAGYHGAKAETGTRNQLRFLIQYSDTLTRFLLILTHWLLRLRGRKNQCDFIREYLDSTRERRDLNRATLARFNTVLEWHIHPRLRFLLPKRRITSSSA